jgi:streptogramin lyase
METVWFLPSRGSEWGSQSDSIVGRLAPDGSLTEHEVAGFGTITHLALGPTDEVWVAGYGSEGDYGEQPIIIGRLGPSATLAEAFTVGLKGWIRSLAIAADAIWFVHDQTEDPETIEHLSLRGEPVQQVSLRPNCDATAIAIGGGTFWFAEACQRPRKGEGFGSARDSINRITPDGKVIRRPLRGSRNYPASLTIGADGTIWFGVSRWGSAPEEVGRITTAGSLAQYPIPDGLPFSIAVGPEGRLWFQSSFGGWNYRALNSIGIGGRTGRPICADPTCSLAPSDLVAAADSSFWYALARPNLNTGGGGSGLYNGNLIANEAGFLANLMP